MKDSWIEIGSAGPNECVSFWIQGDLVKNLGVGERPIQFTGKKGAKVSTRLRHKAAGLSSDDLPPLRSPQDAEAWLERIGRAVATGELVNRDADAATRAVREWLRAHEAGTVTEQVDELRRKVAALGREKLKALP